MSLTSSQQEALDQLSAITASTTSSARERDARLLRENGWDVQVTVEQIFSLGATDGDDQAGSDQLASAGPSQPAVPESEALLPAHKSRTGSGARRASGSRPHRSGTGSTGMGTAGAGIGVLDVVFAPFRLVLGMLSGVWYLFIRTFLPISALRYIPPALLPPSTPGRSNRRTLGSGANPSQDPAHTAQAYIRDLETVTGCSSGAGTLVELQTCGYRDFLNKVKREGKIGLVVLTCGEHEDDAQFKKEVLADQELVRVLKEKDVLVWAADSRTREGYQVAGTLIASTFPSLYFFSLLAGHAGAAPKLNIVSYLAGSPSTSTSASNVLQTLNNTVIPRTSAFLARVRRERHQLEEARHLREEQDRAFAQAEARDRERVLAAREAARREVEERERAKRELEQKEEEGKKRGLWRRYARKHLLPPQPASAGGAGGAIRVAMRTPVNANRNIRLFTPGASTEELFVYAETLLIPDDERPEDDPDSPPANFTPPNDFIVVTSFPRKEVQRLKTGAETEWEVVKQAGGALFAEKKEGSKWGVAAESESEDEGEEDE